MKAILRAQQLRLAALLAALLSLTTAACGGSASSALECEEKGYPCSLAEVPVEILERSNELGDEGVAMLEDGASTAEVKTWLREQPGMAEVGADDISVRFRLEGGRGHWIFTSDAFPTRRRFVAATPDADPAPTRRLAYVAGKHKEQKHALVLSPYKWEFGGVDQGIQIAGILSGTRGYENGVRYLPNDSETDRKVDVGSFRGWGAYQVIHVESHGNVQCDPRPCRTAIWVRDLSESESEAAKLGKLPDVGNGVAVTKSGRSLYLDADFFRYEYGGGLDDTVVFFNSCRAFTAEATDMADAIRGSTSIFLGWDSTISDDANPATLAFYEGLSDGFTAERAHSQLGGLKTTAAGAHFILGKRPAGGDLRIREVVYVLNPETGQVLSTADTVAIEGEPSDGEPDAAPYLVQVDGMPEETAPDALLHVSVDGVEGEPRPVSSGDLEDKDKGRWLLRGVIPLPYDLEEDTRVTYTAWVELPSGGESDHQVDATLTGVEGLGLVWRGEATHVRETVYGTETTVATLTFERKPGQDPKPKQAAYVLTEATITSSLGGRHFLCDSMEASPRTWRIPPEQLDTTIGLPVNGSSVRNGHLVFDLTKKPVRYVGYVRFDAPEPIRAALSGCGAAINDHVRPYSPDPIFLTAGWPEPRERYITPDRKTISGSYDSGGTGVVLRWKWSIRRVR